MQELDGAHENHELVKIKVRVGDRDARNVAIEQLAKATKADVISRVGNIAAMYRPKKENPKILLK